MRCRPCRRCSRSAWPSVALGALRSLLLHLVVFSGIFAAISVVRGLSRLISPRAAVEAWLARAVIAIALAFFLSRVVLRPLALVGRARGDRGCRVRRGVGGGVRSSRDPGAAGSRPGAERPRAAVVDAIARRRNRPGSRWRPSRSGWSNGRRRQSDWNFVIAKSVALASWLIALAAALRMPTDPDATLRRRPLCACFVLLGLNAAVSRVEGVPAQAAEPVASTRRIDPVDHGRARRRRRRYPTSGSSISFSCTRTFRAARTSRR